MEKAKLLHTKDFLVTVQVMQNYLNGQMVIKERKQKGLTVTLDAEGKLDRC